MSWTNKAVLTWGWILTPEEIATLSDEVYEEWLDNEWLISSEASDEEIFSCFSVDADESPKNVTTLPLKVNVEEFEKKLGDALSDEARSFTPDEVMAIESLAEEKYRTWEWNCGRSPMFSLHGEHVTLSAKNGVVLSAG